MQPDLEVVQIGQGQSFKAWEHGLPFHTVRWHFHPELEVHHVIATSGRCYIGDHIGEFGPGQLVLTGPNLPHNWISDVAEGVVIPLRNRDPLVFTGEVYLRHWALPNFFFHLTTAYAILRKNGVQIGKRDFLGAIPGM